jgi:hypothetical protein
MIHQRRYFTNRRPRRGTLYVAVLGVSMIVAICGLCGIQIARLKLKAVRGAMDSQRARILALSAVDHAASIMDHDGNWRATYANDVETSSWSLGGDAFVWKLVDDDGDLSDDPSDPVWVYGIGRVGNAEWIQRARARVDAGLPLEFLRTALHCSRLLEVKGGDNLRAVGAPVSTDATLDNDGTIDGDAEALILTGSGAISGTVVVPAERKGVPPPTLFDDYVARATELLYSGKMEKVVLGPGVNEYGGGLNEDGIYYLNAVGDNVELKKVRIYGTLLIDVGPDKKVTIEDECFLRSYRDDFPALIIRAKTVEIKMKSEEGAKRLDESDAGHNYNPSGATYLGEIDADQADSYPSEIQGLVHVIGDVVIKEEVLVRGCMVVQGEVKVEKSCVFIHDPSLMFNPPRGYTSEPDNTGMIIEPQSWSRHPGL